VGSDRQHGHTQKTAKQEQRHDRPNHHSHDDHDDRHNTPQLYNSGPTTTRVRRRGRGTDMSWKRLERKHWLELPRISPWAFVEGVDDESKQSPLE
jgi:hypothetical protein